VKIGFKLVAMIFSALLVSKIKVGKKSEAVIIQFAKGFFHISCCVATDEKILEKKRNLLHD
jgi:uncharacterized membrane protein